MTYSVFLPCIEERESLLETIQIVRRDNLNEQIEFLIVTDSPENKCAIETYLISSHVPRKLFSCRVQSRPTLSGAILDGIKACLSDYFILMASDLETDPALVSRLIRESKNLPDHIIVVSRWQSLRNFREYGFAKTIANFGFQKLARLLYGTNLTDFTFGYRIYPTAVLKEVTLRSLGHAALLEILLVPLQGRVGVSEIYGSWVRRREGSSKKKWTQNLRYLSILLTLKMNSLLRP